MTFNWTELRRELVIWRREGLHLPIWWRDDDAVEPTPQLDRLERMGAAFDAPIHIAVIPAPAQVSLAQFTQDSRFRILVHGWAHQNHAPQGSKSSEFGVWRAQGHAEITRAARHMRRLFGNQLVPIFVPPWNRIHAGFHGSLMQAGMSGLSTYGPRRGDAVDGLVEINTHIDPVDWRGTRSVVDPALIEARLVATLRARRRGETDAREPLGLLTHHLMQDDAIWKACYAVLSEVLAGGGVWVDVGERIAWPRDGEPSF